MTMLQEKAVQMIQNMSDENVGFLIEIIQRLIPQKKHIEIIYQSQSVDPNKEKMQAFQDAELEAARKEKYGCID